MVKKMTTTNRILSLFKLPYDASFYPLLSERESESIRKTRTRRHGPGMRSHITKFFYRPHYAVSSNQFSTTT